METNCRERQLTYMLSQNRMQRVLNKVRQKCCKDKWWKEYVGKCSCSKIFILNSGTFGENVSSRWNN